MLSMFMLLLAFYFIEKLRYPYLHKKKKKKRKEKKHIRSELFFLFLFNP